jgi:hypothetical protein
MKRFLVLISVFSVVASGVFLAAAVRADDDAPMTEAHIARIKSNCIEAQSTLTQLHATDALLRVNRGQIYELISTKLMAPLNSRIALNRLDGAALVTVATNYEQQLTSFRTHYQQYEEAMSRTLKINCKNQPVAFYDSVTETRDKRKIVHDDAQALQVTIQTYKNDFETFAAKFQEKSS